MTDPRPPYLDAAPSHDELHDFWDAKPQPIRCAICAAMPAIIVGFIMAGLFVYVAFFRWVL